MTAQRAELVRFAEASISRGSKSFAAASRLFDRATRERVWLLYAWCRACDDLADGQDHGGESAATADTADRIARIQDLTEAALAGEPTADPAFDCLSVIANETRLSHAHVYDVVEGFALDGDGWRPESEADLMAYCYHVAGAVGCLMAAVMGVRPADDDTLDRACDLGLAFQLANIARDVAEDARASRCYLPRAWLDEYGLAENGLLTAEARPSVAALTTRLARLSARYEESARLGTPALDGRAAWAVLAAAGIYGGIARKVEQAGEAALDRRMSTSGTEKLGWLVRAGWQSANRVRLYPPRPRDPTLWHRPRIHR